MNLPEKNLQIYSVARQRQRSHFLRQTEIPVEHAISLPLPTKRWGNPGYAYFASPAIRRPDQPMEQGVPDRWWVMDAHGGKLLIYAQCCSQTFYENDNFSVVELPIPGIDINELKQLIQDIETYMDQVVLSFFAGEEGDSALKKTVSELLIRQIPDPLIPQYKALVPDFFHWLEG